MANAIRWMLDFARETAANPLLRARPRRKPWRFALNVALFLAVVIGAAWFLVRLWGYLFPIAMTPLQLYALQRLATPACLLGALLFHVVFLWNARDWTPKRRLADLEATPLSAREIAVGAVGPPIAYGLLAMGLLLVSVSLFVGAELVRAGRGLIGTGFWEMAFGLSVHQWPAWLYAYAAVHSWLLHPGRSGAIRGLLVGGAASLACWFVVANADYPGGYGFGFTAFIAYDRESRLPLMEPGPLPLVPYLLHLALPALSFAALALCGPAAFGRSVQGVRVAGDCWRSSFGTAPSDHAALREAKRGQWRMIREF